MLSTNLLRIAAAVRPIAFLLIFSIVAAAVHAAPPSATAPATKISRLSTVPHPRFPDTEIVVLQLDVPPGASSPHHRHPGLVLGTVVAGEFEFQISGEPLRRLGIGDTFYEPPGAIHLVSRNPSTSVPARVIVFMEHASGSLLVLPAEAPHASKP